ncbi:MAG TPA: acyltransferase family protein [Actinomycetes bacterium]|nr:acyltransferase family protein [Actinomycetes bacterium]
MTTSTLVRPSEVAAATPSTRERYVDFLRVFSLAVVMFGHWLMAAVEWRDGRLMADNVLEAAPAMQWLTWIFQIMPVFFVVGGFSNTASWTAAVRDGRGYGAWLGSRLVRLVRPVLVFAAVWTGGVVALSVAGVDPAAVRAGSMAQPLWFLAVYVVVVALAPAMVAAQRRWGWGGVAALGAGVAAVDLARWPFGVPLVGWANLALVWLFAHQLGVAWRSGAVAAWSRGRLAALAGLGLGGLLVLTGMAGYSTSMVGVGQARSNTFPPSLALVALGTWQFAAVLLLRPAVDRRLDRPRVWAAVVAANGVAMTVFLWHLTALVIVSAVALPTGLIASPPAGSAGWWVWRPVWIVALVLVLVPLVAAFARVELRRVTAPAPSGVRAAVAAVLLAVGMAVLARKGFVPAGMAGAGLVAGGWAVLRRA